MSTTKFELEHGYTPCPFTFGGAACGYVGDAVSCAKTVDACRERGMVHRFGGQVSTDPDALEARRVATVSRTVERWREEDAQ